MPATKSECVARALYEVESATASELAERATQLFDTEVSTTVVYTVVNALAEQKLVQKEDTYPTTYTFTPDACPIAEDVPEQITLEDGHPASEFVRDYIREVDGSSEWPLPSLSHNLAVGTSTQCERRHGALKTRSSYQKPLLEVSEKTWNNVSEDDFKRIIRHEMVHLWQYQHGHASVDHGHTFRIWLDGMELNGRTSNTFTDEASDKKYLLVCPSCEGWSGRYRLSKAVRMAGAGSDSYHQFCVKCNVKVYVGRANDGEIEVLPHRLYSDDELRAFAEGDDSFTTHSLSDVECLPVEA